MKIDNTVVLLLVIAVAMHASIAGIYQWDAIVYAGCLAIALTLRLHRAVHAALLTTLAAVITLIPVLNQAIGHLPVLPLLIPLLISSLLVAASPATRPSLRWVRRGRISTSMWFLIGVTGVGSAVALIAWAVWTDRFGIGAQMMASVAHLPPLVLTLIVIPVFALFNAVTEEAVFRGVLYTALVRSSKSPWFAIVVQAAAFAALHFEMGFPNGPMGYAMVLTYGLFLGYLRARTGGLLAPIAAHVVADLVIGYILLFGPPMRA